MAAGDLSFIFITSLSILSPVSSTRKIEVRLLLLVYYQFNTTKRLNACYSYVFMLTTPFKNGVEGILYSGLPSVSPKNLVNTRVVTCEFANFRLKISVNLF